MPKVAQALCEPQSNVIQFPTRVSEKKPAGNIVNLNDLLRPDESVLYNVDGQWHQLETPDGVWFLIKAEVAA